MARQRTRHSRITYAFPDDFAQRLERFKEESGLSWAELSRRLGGHPLAVRRWRLAGVQPNFRHLMALLDLTDKSRPGRDARSETDNSTKARSVRETMKVEEGQP